MKSVSHLFDLFYPPICACCEENLLDQEHIVCLLCRFDLPLVDNLDFTTNAISKVFEGRVLLEKSASFLLYRETGKAKQLIHELKYKNNQQIGVFIANWFGKILVKSEQFQNIDYIIPVPLHKKKLKKRGYNQLTTFGNKLSEILEIKYNDELLKRISFTKTQTHKNRLDRFQNTDSKFVLEEPNLLTNKHILLIDDVVTTGATLEACCKELMKAENVKISIITMAITE